MAGKELKAQSKKVLKISRDGAVERDLVQKSEIRISGITQDAVLKKDSPVDELFASHEKPQDTAEKPKKRKPRFIDTQQQEASKLQADYVTQRSETPLTFETSTVSEDKQAVSEQPADNSAIPEQTADDKKPEHVETQKSADSRNDSSDLSDAPQDYNSEAYSDWRSEDTGVPKSEQPSGDRDFSFHSSEIISSKDVSEKKGKHRKLKIEKDAGTPETTAAGHADDQNFPKHSSDDIAFRGAAQIAESSVNKSPERKGKSKLRHERTENPVEENTEETEISVTNTDDDLFPKHSADNFDLRGTTEQPPKEKPETPKRRNKPKLQEEHQAPEAPAAGQASALQSDNEQFSRHSADNFDIRGVQEQRPQEHPETEERHIDDISLNRGSDIPVLKADKTRNTLQKHSVFAEKLIRTRTRASSGTPEKDTPKRRRQGKKELVPQSDSVKGDVQDAKIIKSEKTQTDEDRRIKTDDIPFYRLSGEPVVQADKARSVRKEHSAVSEKLTENRTTGTLPKEAESQENTGGSAQNTEDIQPVFSPDEEMDIEYQDIVFHWGGDQARTEPEKHSDKLKHSSGRAAKLASKKASRSSHKKVSLKKRKQKPRSDAAEKQQSQDTVQSSNTASEARNDSFVRPADIPITSAEIRADSQIQRFERRAEKAEKKLEKAQVKAEKAERHLPTERVIKTERTFDENTGKAKRKIKLEKQAKPSDKPQNPVISGTKSIVSGAASYAVGTVKNEFAKYEDENSALKALDGAERIGETALRFSRDELKREAGKIKQFPYKKTSKLKYEAEKAEKKLEYQRNKQQAAELRKKQAQREAVKKSQQKQARKKAQRSAKNTAEKVEETAEQLVKGVINIIKNPIALIIIVIIAAIIVMINCFASLFGMLVSSTAPIPILTSYTSKDSDIYAAEEYMISLEDNMISSLDSIPEDYPDYDEYRFFIANPDHDPYSLISFLTAKKEMFTIDDVRGYIQTYFDKLYNLTLKEVEEIREYRYTYTDENGEEQTEIEEITFKILEINLSINDLNYVLGTSLTESEYDLYKILMDTKGNRPDLFPEEVED